MASTYSLCSDPLALIEQEFSKGNSIDFRTSTSPQSSSNGYCDPHREDADDAYDKILNLFGKTDWYAVTTPGYIIHLLPSAALAEQFAKELDKMIDSFRRYGCD